MVSCLAARSASVLPMGVVVVEKLAIGRAVTFALIAVLTNGSPVIEVTWSFAAGWPLPPLGP